MADNKKTTEKREASLCTVCLGKDFQKGLMCNNCFEDHKGEVVAAVRAHQSAQTQIEFATAKTSENLAVLKKELGSKMEQIKPFFDQAYSDVQRDLRGVRLEKEVFLGLVKERCDEILQKAGQEELVKRVDWLKNAIQECGSKLRWYRKIEAKKDQTGDAKTETGEAADVSDETAAA